MKYVTFIILNKILINIRYSLSLLFNIFITYFAISGYLSQITVRKQKRMIASYSYCPLYRAAFTIKEDNESILYYHYCPLYLATFTKYQQIILEVEKSYCPLYRATFTPLIITLVLLHYHLFSQKSIINVQKVGQPIIL